ncbi:MAG: GLUG motif-containing protein [Planctomycetota bacterium]
MCKLTFSIVLLVISVNTAAALPGSGTQQDPWRIESPADFNEFAGDANYWAGYTRLETDVNLAGRTYTTAVIAPDESRSDGFQGARFTGVFEGDGHKVAGLTIDDAGAGNEFLGLFGCNVNGELRNLGIEGGSVSGSGDRYIGGLVGHNNGVVSDCYFAGSVRGTKGAVGGLAGRNYEAGRISNCYFSGNVTGNLIRPWRGVGGLTADNYGIVSNCYSTGSVNGHANVGGLVGRIWRGSVWNCYSTGSVSGDDNVGGLVGYNNMGTISNCYSTGSVSGRGAVGGLVGVNGGSISNCFWDINTSGTTTSSGGTGLPTAQMQAESTFTSAGWDFTTPIWIMCDEPDYPKLSWEKCPLPPIEVPMKFTPQALNPSSRGNWIKAHLVLPQEYTVEDVDANSPAVIEPGQIESDYINVFLNDDGLVEIEAAFDRAEFCSIVTGGAPMEVKVVGSLTSGQQFYGADTIKITTNFLMYLRTLGSRWLEAGCGRPDWCRGLDLNQDSLVNLVDLALFDTCCIEVIRQ